MAVGAKNPRAFALMQDQIDLLKDLHRIISTREVFDLKHRIRHAYRPNRLRSLPGP